MRHDPTPAASKLTIPVELRTGLPYANLIAKQALFAATVGEVFGIDPRSAIPMPGTTGAIEAVRNHVFRISGKTTPTVLTVCPGYWRARESFAGFGFSVRAVHTKPLGFSIDESSIVDEARQAPADLIYLSLPNNPTGAVFDPGSIIESAPRETAIVFDMTLPARGLDTKNLASRLYEKFNGRRNLFLAGSTSKSHATAELRVGWLICANSEDAALLKEENRNVVASDAIDRGIEALYSTPSVFPAIEESFAFLEEGERTNSLEIIRPDRRVETGYVLIKPRLSPDESRRTLGDLNIRVMWGSEFGLDDEYIRLETLEPANIRVFVDAVREAVSAKSGRPGREVR